MVFSSVCLRNGAIEKPNMTESDPFSHKFKTEQLYHECNFWRLEGRSIVRNPLSPLSNTSTNLFEYQKIWYRMAWWTKNTIHILTCVVQDRLRPSQARASTYVTAISQFCVSLMPQWCLSNVSVHLNFISAILNFITVSQFCLSFVTDLPKLSINFV